MPDLKYFASDNFAGVHPKIVEALVKANAGRARAYGHDELTQRTARRFKEVFGPDAETFFVFIGTASNVLALTALTRPHQGVICATTAHINCDEGGAPEAFNGSKLLTVPSTDGKLSVSGARRYIRDIGVEHHSQPKVISITQPTELGTVYTVDELRAITDFAHSHDLYVHMDGARLANAAAYLNVSLAALTSEVGVDVLSFGGTKNGLMFGEAVVFLKPGLGAEFRYIRKRGMQLYSKMRFIAAQFEALLEDDLWLTNARASNAAARIIADNIADIPGVRVNQAVQTNAIFASLPQAAIDRLLPEFDFYLWNPDTLECRWMTAFDTTPEEAQEFALAIRKAVGNM